MLRGAPAYCRQTSFSVSAGACGCFGFSRADAMHAVLWRGYLSDDEPVRVQLRRCAIHGALVTLTPKYSLTNGIVSTIYIGPIFFGSSYAWAFGLVGNAFRVLNFRVCLCLCSVMFLEDWQVLPMINKYRAGDVASGAMDGAAPESRLDGVLRE